MTTANVFILTGEWFDVKGKNVLRLFGISEECGPVELIFDRVKPVFFVNSDALLNGLTVNYSRKQLQMASFEGNKVDAVYFNTQRDLKTAAEYLDAQNITTYESDVDPVRRFLMERFINVQALVTGEERKKSSLTVFTNPKIKPAGITPQFVIASIDIETGIKNDDLYSIAVHITGRGGENKKVFMMGSGSKKIQDYISLFDTEKELLIEFTAWFKQADPDIIIGWHVIGFDLMFLEKKYQSLNVPFDLARDNGRTTLKVRKSGGYYASMPGRVIIDGPATLRASFFSFEDFKLETVARELLGKGKVISPEKNKVGEIEKYFKDDKVKLAEYNLTDAVLVSEIFNKVGLIELSVKRAQISGMLMDQLGMMTAAFDHFLLPRIHRAGYVACNVRDIAEMEHAAGGYVFDPKPGLYDNVIVLDFKSLYPSIIRTFKIDPVSRLLSAESTIQTPNGYKFSAAKHFLPEFITELMKKRGEAKEKNDKQLSQAIKILMNSFYGVMGSYGCRFYHPDLPTAITGTGQYLLLGSKDYFENDGYEVIYGDTDSLFVKLKEGEGDIRLEAGKKLADALNNYWKEKLKNEYKVESYLEIEYEKFYRKFIITAARGSEAGAKKRYAGLLVKDGREKLDFVGMEFVRSDWTRLAKDFQVELYTRIFNGSDIKDWIRGIVAKVNKGEFDEKLVYKKRLRKGIEQYTKNIPPQVKAARMINQQSGTIYYVITKQGPVPVELEPAEIDYQHYIDKQLKPIADSVLNLFGESFDTIVNSSQLNFFN
ncbi:MAG: DNA polymerase II [Ignavibacteriaceae bacterium]|nr:DNA polymerase II [Ignavibacteriaceae bacterium]